jgi:sulfofructosephosphate aldolase
MLNMSEIVRNTAQIVKWRCAHCATGRLLLRKSRARIGPCTSREVRTRPSCPERAARLTPARPGAGRSRCSPSITGRTFGASSAPTILPWVRLSGGVDDATFERQVPAACRAGASGVLVGRSVWAPAATMAASARDAWLASGRARLEAFDRLVDDLGAPWHARPNSLTAAVPPGEGRYREY